MVQPHIDSMNIAGLAIGVARNDTILLLKSYGYADLEFDVALPVSASFEIGSVTKQFTSVAILQLVDKGLICLEDDLNEYVEFDTKGRKITIEKLMNHTSGIKGYTELSSFRDFSVHDYPRDTLLRIVEQEEFDFEPGEAMIYNNTAYFMLGLIIEKVTGQTYEEYLQENIFSKAGMDNSYYCDERKIMKKKAYGYDTGKGGKLVKAAYLDHKWPYSAGSLCSTAEDLLKWNHILHESETILNKEMYELLITPSRLQDGTTIRYAKGLFVDKYKGIIWMPDLLLDVEGLETQFNTSDGVVHAVNGVTFGLQEGETLGVVGESGCGKSVTMLSLLRLIPTPPGKIKTLIIKKTNIISNI